jgi:hypothetical protein
MKGIFQANGNKRSRRAMPAMVLASAALLGGLLAEVGLDGAF